MTLKLNQVAKSFHQGETELRILENLEMQLNAGEIVAIVGESGSGKSTLLSLLAGFERPDKGDIEWEGRGTRDWSEEEWASFRRESLGFVFQNYHLIPYLTARENVALPLRLKGQTPDGAEALLARLGLGARLTHLPSQLSGGESQRVAIARALIHKPRLVLADEPTGSLDARTGHSVLDLLFDLLRESKQTALIVTHSQEVANKCDRILTLRQGKLWPT
jgi:putative ABC transport system ATP-binding protein